MGKFVPTKELKKEVSRVLKQNKELEKATVAQIRKLKKLPFEEFKKEVCIRLEDIYKTLRTLGDEMIQGYLQDREIMDDLLAVLKKVREQDRRDFRAMLKEGGRS